MSRDFYDLTIEGFNGFWKVFLEGLSVRIIGWKWKYANYPDIHGMISIREEFGDTVKSKNFIGKEEQDAFQY